MNTYLIQLEATTNPATIEHPNQILEHIEAVFDALTELEGEQLTETDLSANLAEARIAFELTINATDAIDAFGIAATMIRTAIHTAGGSTPGWEHLVQAITTNTRTLTEA